MSKEKLCEKDKWHKAYNYAANGFFREAYKVLDDSNPVEPIVSLLKEEKQKLMLWNINTGHIRDPYFTPQMVYEREMRLINKVLGELESS